MTRHVSFIVLLIVFNGACSFVSSQGAFFIDEKSVINANRYSEIKGSPYYLENWAKCDFTDVDGNQIKGVDVNLNGYSGGVEARKSERIMEVDMSYLTKTVCTADGKTFEIVNGGDVESKIPYVFTLYEGGEYCLVEEFWVALSEKTFNNYGETRVMKRFSPKQQYSLLVGGKRYDLKLRKKEFVKLLTDQEKAEDFIKTKNLKMREIDDYIAVLQYLQNL